MMRHTRWIHHFLWIAFLSFSSSGVFVSVSATRNSQSTRIIASAASHDDDDDKDKNVILVVGSANVDTFLPVQRLPLEGENLTTLKEPIVDIPGGKGCTQAVAVAKLIRSSTTTRTRFVGQFGQDTAGALLLATLEQHHIDCSHCHVHNHLPSGRGYVFLSASGSVSAVVSGGSNAHGWQRWKRAWDIRQRRQQQPQSANHADDEEDMEQELNNILKGVQCILLQREVPEYVNLLIATYAKQKDPSILICQDIGGEDRPISFHMLTLCDYVVPNESELKRLVVGEQQQQQQQSTDDDATRLDDDAIIVEYAQRLQHMGANSVLVTRGAKGSTLVDKQQQVIHHQPAILLPPHQPVIDETGAGDCYRAAFCVALLEHGQQRDQYQQQQQQVHTVKQCMLFASAAGSCSVERNGAVPSTPSRSRVLNRLAEQQVLDIPRGDGQRGQWGVKAAENNDIPRGGGHHTNNNIDNGNPENDDPFPFLFGSRLNSMKDRPDLWDENKLGNPRDYVQRQASVRGLTCVDFNFPQHFGSFWTIQEAKAELDQAGLVAGAVCLRYPSSFARGAMNHPVNDMRRKAIELTKQAAEAAMVLGTNEVVIWSAYDGYDYPFQVDYDQKWDQLVSAFQELCDEYPSVKFSLEYKPTDENTRFFTVPTTGAALLFVEEVNRPNMGLTLDVGHMLMAGENPGQSIAMVGRKHKLFGIQLNDGFTRLAAEDGLMFGSVHPTMALEIMYQLRRTNFCGHFYFDTFPQRSDPVKEAEYNIRQAKRFWNAACSIDETQLRRITDEHDAIAALNLVNNVLWGHLERKA